MAVISMKALLESGVHFGHRTNKWDPRMKPYIFTERNGIHIIDLQQTVKSLNNAYTIVRDCVMNGGTVLFVGTKRQAREIIADAAKKVATITAISPFLVIDADVALATFLFGLAASGAFGKGPDLQPCEVICDERINEAAEGGAQLLLGYYDLESLPENVAVLDGQGVIVAVGVRVGVGVHYLSLPEHPYYREALGWRPEEVPHPMTLWRAAIHPEDAPRVSAATQLRATSSTWTSLP